MSVTNEHTDGPVPLHAGSLVPLVKTLALRDDAV
jgi:hypothetical protein